MSKSGVSRHIVLAFLIALVVYAVSYTWIEHMRTRKGPWEVRFGASDEQTPSVTIYQPSMGISNVQITFSGQHSTLTNATILFRQPRPVPFDVPYGRCLFMDTTFLPGTVTFRLFGHEIELLPRVLIVDQHEQSWKSGSTLDLPLRAEPQSPKQL